MHGYSYVSGGGGGTVGCWLAPVCAFAHVFVSVCIRQQRDLRAKTVNVDDDIRDFCAEKFRARSFN